MTDTNGSNSWDVPYSQITWFERLLESHQNVAQVQRHHDIIFEVDRVKQRDHLKILCCRQYTMGLTMVHRALHEFGELNLIYIGGGWCGYSIEAKEFCLASKMGLFNTDEMSGALWSNEFWGYYKKDKEGTPQHPYRDS